MGTNQELSRHSARAQGPGSAAQVRGKEPGPQETSCGSFLLISPEQDGLTGPAPALQEHRHLHS